MGEHMKQVIELLDELNGDDTEAKLKLLAMMTAEYMLNVDTTGYEITAGKMKISVDIYIED